MSDFRQLGYDLFKAWSDAVEKFNKRPGGVYGPGINSGSTTRLSPSEGKLEYMSVEAQLHHSGKVLAEARIDFNFDDQTLDITHPNHSVERVQSEGVEVSGLVERVISELTANKVSH